MTIQDYLDKLNTRFKTGISTEHSYQGDIRNLLESPKVSQFITPCPITGNNLVSTPRFESTPSETDHLTTSPLHQFTNSKTHHFTSSPVHQLGKVLINDQQYFDRVPFMAWNFYIGGYQPAQKCFKNRKRRELSFEDILHYQKIIVV